MSRKLIVLSHYQVAPVLAARLRGETRASLSVDLGRSVVEVVFDSAGLEFPDGDTLAWEDAGRIVEAENKCFILRNNTIEAIQTFSEVTNWARSLFPTASAPTMLVSGVTMHRISGTDPMRDTHAKIRKIAPIAGKVLDTATGLGYTAIEASRSGAHVVTIEIDPASLEIARLNPWSEELFDNPRIRQIIGDAFDEVGEFEDGEFLRIVHDPPMFSLAGDLYSTEFYREMHRVLDRRGRMFHYIGDLSSKSGQGVLRGVQKRLIEAGFSRVARRPEAFGVVAYK